MPIAMQAAERAEPAGLALSDAAGVRLVDRRHHHPDRHLAQHADLPGAGGGDRATRPACSTSPPIGPAAFGASRSLFLASAGGCCRRTGGAGRPPRRGSRSRTTPARRWCRRVRRWRGRPCATLEAMGEGEVDGDRHHPRGQTRRYIPARALGAVRRRHAGAAGRSGGAEAAGGPGAGCELLGSGRVAACSREDEDDELETVEAVVSAGLPADRADARGRCGCGQRFEVNVLALSRRRPARSPDGCGSAASAVGDVVVLQGRSQPA